MNIPISIWTVLIVHKGKIVNIGRHANISPPTSSDVKAMAKAKGYNTYSDYTYIMIDESP